MPICIRCEHARFPGPEEQCYKFGGLICEKYKTNVGKYDRCSEVRARLGIDSENPNVENKNRRDE